METNQVQIIRGGRHAKLRHEEVEETVGIQGPTQKWRSEIVRDRGIRNPGVR